MGLFDSAWAAVVGVAGALFDPAVPEPITLDKLEKWITDLDNQSPPPLRLNGISFDRSYNKSLGFPGDRPDFTVFMPSAKLAVRNDKSSFPSTSQQAFLDVLNKGLERTDTKTILIDIASLKPEDLYFNEGKEESIISQLGKLLRGIDQSKEVAIRLLVGDETKSSSGFKSENLDEYWDGMKSRYEELFWTKSTKADGGAQYTPKIQHPNATLYVGIYTPEFRPLSTVGNAKAVQPFDNSNDGTIKDLKAFLHKALGTSVVQISKFFNFLDESSLNVDKLVEDIVKNTVPSITWNHGKILAVNGTALMTGGINYWSLYAAGDEHAHDICDHACKISGDAAVSAHRWADYFWSYLEKPSPTDKTSISRSTKLAASTAPVWGTISPVPLSVEFKKVVPIKGGPSVLTVGRLGDWHGDMKAIQYPVQVVDAIRDVILNLAWQYYNPHAFEEYSEKFLLLAGALSDDKIAPLLFHELGINPTAWASRYARIQAITAASKNIVICQQMLVCCLQNDTKEWMTFANEKSAQIKAKGGLGEPWDGALWPIDLLIALAQALGNMYRSEVGTPNTDGKNFKKESKGIYIVLTTNQLKKVEEGGHPGWQDVTPIWKFKQRLRQIMSALPTQYGGVPANVIDKLLNEMIHFRRTGTTSDLAHHGLWSHSKVVCVDGRALYVGSDNAYPAYNEEHGVWVDDDKTINGWLDVFFSDYWGRLQVPDDLVQPK